MTKLERARSHLIDPTRPGLQIELVAAEAAELLLSLLTIAGDGARDETSFDLAAEEIREHRSKVPRSLLRAVQALPGRTTLVAQLLPVVYESPRPRNADAFLERLRSMDPREVQLHLLGYYTRGHHVAPPETILAAADGDAVAAEELVRAAGEWAEKREGVEWLLAQGAQAATERLVGVFTEWNTKVFASSIAEVRAVLERDAEEKRQLAERVPPTEFVEIATRGIGYVPRPDIHKLVFFPSYWFRPWVLHAEYGTVRLFCYPVDADRPTVGPPAEALEMARVYKALGDAKRLRLLELLRDGPVSLGEAARAVDLSKSTTHHHLAILRQAGLVRINEDDDKSYALRSNNLARASRLIERHFRL